MMRNLNLINFFILFLISLMLVSCEDSVENSQTTGSVEIPAEYVDLTFTAAASQQIIQFAATSDWSIALTDTKASVDWVEVYPTSGGAGESSVTITLGDNTTGEDREAIITITSGDSSQEITIVQIAPGIVTLSYVNYSVVIDPEAITKVEGEGENYLIASSSLQSEFSIYSSQEWVVLTQESSDNQESSGYILAEVNENEVSQGRKAYVVVSMGETSSVLAISQLGSNGSSEFVDFEIDPNESKEYYPAGGSFEFDVTTDLAWSASATQSWAAISDASNNDSNEKSTTSFTGDGAIRVTIAENESIKPRQVAIILSTDSHSEAMLVKQQGVEFSIDPEGSVEIDNEETEIPVEIESNYIWDIECSEDWIEIDIVQGDGNEEITITALYNDESGDRSATVTFTCGDITETLEIIQKGIISGSDPSTNYLIISPSGEKYVDVEGEEFDITVSSNVSWEVECNKDWVTLSPLSGENNGEINVIVAENTTNEQRRATITVSGGGITRTLVIIQEAKPYDYLEISPSGERVVGYEGETFNISVISNILWSVSESASWITVSPLSGENNGEISVIVAENTTGEQRTATITVSGGDITRTLVIIQEAESDDSETKYLIISPSGEKIIGYTGEKFNIDVSSNVSWNASELASWISVSPSFGSNDGTISVTVAENTTYYARSATITVSGGGITRTLVITQEAAPYLEISPSGEKAVEYIGASFSISVTSNISWSVSKSASWVSIDTYSGFGHGSIGVVVDENTTSEARSATITVSGGGITRTLVIIQAGGPYLEISPSTEKQVEYLGEKFNLDITSNVNWTVSESANWIAISSSTGSDNGSILVTVTENTTFQSRSATITVSGGGITRTLVITQNAADEYLDLSTYDIAMPYTEDSAQVEVLTNTIWYTTGVPTWLQISPTYSLTSQNQIVTIYAEANATSEERNASITFYTESGLSAVLNITQEAFGAGELTLELTDLNKVQL